ncbi:hypothetical protein NP493_105g02031 [Ridgeia piscesae]|uniref:Uncharacterized protein n=1 Tax=Ridgeia piscesae TaxID=27915 RepID=A0AAD9UHK3_RIDPI|nr:hypothetical protein NP493_105g02031 [Ridgeia piscesae]
MIAVQLESKRGIAKNRCCSTRSLPPPQIQNCAYGHNHRRAKSFGGNITHSHIRRRRHDCRSTTVEMRHRESATLATDRIRRHDCFFLEQPILPPQQQPVSSNFASYVLSLSCLFLCGPLRRISVNARFYVQCCLVL